MVSVVNLCLYNGEQTCRISSRPCTEASDLLWIATPKQLFIRSGMRA